MACLISREGWVPIRFVWTGSEALVDWCRLGGERFTDPFFDNTIEFAQSSPFNRLFTHRTLIDELGEWYAASPGMMPSGFIFHMSRCGSTLVSRMLAALPENVVISEAGPLDRLARAVSIPEATRTEWLRWMVSALGQRRAGGETRYFIKFDSLTVLALPFIRRVFPSVPWIFVYRNPEEVLISHLRAPAPAMSPGVITDIAVLDMPAAQALSMNGAEYAARVIGRLCECAVREMDACGLPVNYTALPEAVWGGIARRFGTAFAPEEIALMRGVAQYHAKRPGQRFESDAEGKRRGVSYAVREAARRWILPGFEQLERMSR